MGKLLIKTMDTLLDTAIVLICMLLLFIGLYSMLDNLWLYQNASDDSLLRYKPALDELLTPERKISENQVAWLIVNNTSIDYPILQGEDNYEYLNKNPYGEFSLSGSIFLDSRNNPDFTDDYNLIYGHHMSHGAMFGALDSFGDRGYFDAHRSGSLVTAKAVYQIEFFAVSYADGTNQTLFNPKNRTSLEILAFLQENAITYLPPEEELPFLVLSTCTGDASTERLLIFGTLK